MKMKNVNFKPSKILANISLKLGKMSAESACIYIYHQPQMPEELKSLKSK
ncbi:cyclic lactone autoinducer peptide [Mediterraneibacter gnavus]|jgi:AgrD protein|nr:cyclic lactone autoinducer peptide [Mediterraneibacter gnavus]